MKKIIFQNVNSIIENNKELFKKFKKLNIDMIVLTGGFSNCKILIDEIKRNFNSIPYKILSRPETSVMNGAVLYGIEPNKKVSRKAPYTIGLSTYSLHKIGTECREKRIIDFIEKCLYFDIYKRVGDDIKNGDIIIRTYLPLYQSQKGVDIRLYYSNSINPIYIDDKGIKQIAKFSLDMKETDIPKDQRIAEVKMKFSSCITISAKNKLSGEKITITANYYNRND